MTESDAVAGNPPGDADPPAAQARGPAKADPSRHLIVYIDGACSGNPGPCGCAAVIQTDDGVTVLEKARAFGPATNNVAEYQALLLGLEAAAQLKPSRLTIRSDSELLVRQIAGQYRIKAPHLKALHRQAMRMLEPFGQVEIEHISRTLNKEADALARKALEKARTVDASIPPEARKKPQPKTFRLK